MKGTSPISKIAVHNSRGRRAGHARGFCYDANPALADQATDAYEERRERLSHAWSNRREDREALKDSNDITPQNAQAMAELAWQDRKERLQHQWEQKDA
jgi:hypothetical protein